MNTSDENVSECRSCGEPLTRRFCSACGLDSQCASCGAKVTGPFCGDCGTSTGGTASASTAGALSGTEAASKSARSKWLVPVAVAVVLLLLAGTAAAVALNGDSGKSSSSEVAQDVVESTTTIASTTTTQLATTTVPTTAAPVGCPTDPTSLKTAVSLSKMYDANTLTHMGVRAGSNNFAMGTKYIRFTLEAIDQLGGQGGGVFMRCDGGTWTLLTIVDGMSCDPRWTGDDRAAAVTLRIC